MDGQKPSRWQRHERRKVGTEIEISLQVRVKIANRPRFVATNADLLHDLHPVQADKEQTTIPRMHDRMFVTDKRDSFGGRIVFERPRYSAEFRSVGELVKSNAPAGDHQEAFPRTIKTWRCRIGEIGKSLHSQFAAVVVSPVQALSVLAGSNPQRHSGFDWMVEQHQFRTFKWV